ncbi:MAG: DUF6089 family protein [Saprospiraceae bacterium]|nr:DUF6089 family protein [Saprospiraceae bacterium]
MKKGITILLVLSTFFLQAQPIDIGITIGAMAYNGDVSPASPFDLAQQIRPSFGVFGRTSFSNRLSAKLMINFGSVDGSDAFSAYPERGLQFQSKIVEANLTGELHLIRIRHTESSFTFPYFYGGVGLFHFNPKAELPDGSLVELQPLGTEGQGLPGYEKKYSRTQVNFPMGAGVRFILSDRWSIAFEIGGRMLLTDYLDDVSDTDINYRELYEGNGPVAAQLSNPNLPDEPVDVQYRRGSDANDWYYTGLFMASYNFGQAIRKAFRDPVPCFNGW